jgi:hypothetical protein
VSALVKLMLRYEEMPIMENLGFTPLTHAVSAFSRRAALRGLVAGGTVAALAGRWFERTAAQVATPAAEACVATAPPLEDGIGFTQLLVGGIVPDMPAGPVEVRISRLAMAPGTTIEASAVPYPALMYMEAGTTACPGGPGRIGYGPDGTVIEETTGEGIQYTPAGSTQYIPANVPDGAGNEETELMSSIIIEFVPVEQTATPTA